jgi:hypothetical protein
MIIDGLCRDSTLIVVSFLSIEECINKFGYDVKFIMNHPEFEVNNIYFQMACFGGHRDLVELMIEKGANWWNCGFLGACSGGKRDLIDLMIEKGADDWNCGLYLACYHDYRDIAKLMIKKGAHNWNWGFESAYIKTMKI